MRFMKGAAALTAALLVIFTTGVFGEEGREILKIKGTVTRIDAAAKIIVIKQAQGKETSVIMEDHADELAKVKVGESAEARYYVYDGKYIGYKIKKISEPCP